MSHDARDHDGPDPDTLDPRETDLAAPDDAPGLTRFHLVAGGECVGTACDLARGWCADRAVPRGPADRLVHLVHAAGQRAMELRPRRLAVGLRWLDADRVVLDVRAFGCRASAWGPRQRYAGPSAMVFDATSEGWGARWGGRESVSWFVVDTSA